MVGIPLPDDGVLPPGPRRELVVALHELYDLAGKPSTRKLSAHIRARDDLPGTLSHEGVSAVLRGSSGLARWLNLESLVRVLCDSAVVPMNIESEVAYIHSLWRAAAATEPSKVPNGTNLRTGESREKPPERDRTIHRHRNHQLRKQHSMGKLTRGPISRLPHDEITRVDLANHDWVASTRSFHFLRLLQAIEEVELRTGRLEAGRVFNQVLQMSGAATRATGPRLLRACDLLSENDLFQANWRLRRMLSRVIGDIIGLQLTQGNRVLVGEFCEAHLENTRGAQLLAEAASEHTAAAAAVGSPVLRRLLLSPHPLTPWQLLRRWTFVSPIIADRVAFEDIVAVKDLSTRRMLTLTQIHFARRSPIVLKQLLGAMKSAYGDLGSDERSHSFFEAVAAWVATNSSISLPDSVRLPNTSPQIEQLLYLIDRLDDDEPTLITMIGHALELDSVDRDILNFGTHYQYDSGGRYSEGRYGYTRRIVRRVFQTVSPDSIHPVCSSLLRCADEGIRWAMATELPHWWTRAPDGKESTQTVMQLIGDEHPWVARETLQQLAADELLCHSIGLTVLAGLAEETRARFAAQGRLTTDLANAVRRIRAIP